MSEWFSYDWELHELEARYQVDLAYAHAFFEEALAGFTTLLFISCFPGAQGDNLFSARERRRLGAVLARCQKLLGDAAVYVGSIDTGTQCRYYFYAADARLLVGLYDLCSKEKVLTLECGKNDEPARQSYFQLLYPDEAKKQGADNAVYIAALKKRGDELSAPRRVNFHLYFPTVYARIDFLREALQAGFAIGRTEFVPEHDAPHYAVVHAVSPLEWKAVTALTTRVIYLALPREGQFSHFDSAFIAKRRF